MSRHRVRPDRGHVDPSRLPRGPNGLALCRYCGNECQPPRRTFCSDACIHEWKLRTQPAYARKLVYKRDRGACAICGEVVFGVQRSSRYGCNVSVKLWEMDHIVPVIEGGGECGLDNLRTLCPPHHKAVTRALARRRAQARKANRPPP